MSIFSKIRGAKKAAEKHKGSKTQEKAAEEKAAPYRHVPTHAAIDALSGAPSSWKAEDRSAIKAHHKRRSALIRNSSNLSAVPSMKRTSSYNTSEWGLTPVLEPKKSHLGPPGHTGQHSHLGYQADAGSPIVKSPLSSNEISPIASSGVSAASSSSSQVLELPARTQSARVRPESNIFDHIHKSTHRRVGEAPLWDVAPSRPRINGSTTPAAVAPVSPKKRGWGFSKKNTAVAAH
ncbi:hypothetical protein LPUS_10387 [Lasallia pustulata]|uniref:Uncharacterized protein n=1 Tax=Lasallia pustulata TaxID=136370 RepID=A0A1W5D9H9_9LECA|nr:hypothetical protein LPUS_10387 [Lasallia pustulata]